MNMPPPDFPPMPRAGQDDVLPPEAHAAATGRKWAALQDAAAIVAELAGIAIAPPSAALRDFPAAIRAASGWRRNQAEEGIDDLAAIMEAGLAALLAVNARGADAKAAALALWREYAAARTALLALVAQPPATGQAQG